jgi:uncharacterized protein YceK
MHRRSAIGLAGTLALALGGCGTANNLLLPEGEAKAQGAGPPARVYGGVGLDARVGTSWLAAPFGGQPAPDVPAWEKALDGTCKVAIGAFVLGVDLPLSLVGDTVTLPLTVPATLQKQREQGADTKGRSE